MHPMGSRVGLGPARTASKSANGTSTSKRSDSWLFSEVEVSTKYVVELTPHFGGVGGAGFGRGGPGGPFGLPWVGGR
jgi:hypothetical protein